METQEIANNCRSVCGTKSVAMGFSESAGHEIYDRCMTDDFKKWDENQFIDWVMEMQVLYGTTSPTGQLLISLYKECSKIMRQYGDLIQRSLQ